VNGPLSVVVIAASLALAVWLLLRAAINRPPSRLDLVATLALGVLVLALAVAGVVIMFGDNAPSEAATFAGYLITTACVLPTAGVLARMEPTRWGSVILGVACLTIPALVLRLQQIAAVTGG
jgi:asparagine N-glycosylation enzyme membrane subunit Stt3